MIHVIAKIVKFLSRASIDPPFEMSWFYTFNIHERISNSLSKRIMKLIVGIMSFTTCLYPREQTTVDTQTLSLVIFSW